MKGKAVMANNILVAAGLTEEEVTRLRNTNKFSYYAIERNGKARCQLCGPPGPRNIVCDTCGDWRVWPVHIDFLPEGIRDHKLYTTPFHDTRLSSQPPERVVDLVTLLRRQVLEGASGPAPRIRLNGIPISKYSVCAALVTPDRTERLQAIFDVSMATGCVIPGGVPTHREGGWRCDLYWEVGPGVKALHIIHPVNEALVDFAQMQNSDYVDIINLARKTDNELHQCGRGGTLLMGLPGGFALSARSGPLEDTACSQGHLHINTKRSTTWDQGGVVTETLCKSPQDLEAKDEILARWETMYQYIQSHPGTTETDARAALSPADREFLASKKK